MSDQYDHVQAALTKAIALAASGSNETALTSFVGDLSRHESTMASAPMVGQRGAVLLLAGNMTSADEMESFLRREAAACLSPVISLQHPAP